MTDTPDIRRYSVLFEYTLRGKVRQDVRTVAIGATSNKITTVDDIPTILGIVTGSETKVNVLNVVDITDEPEAANL